MKLRTTISKYHSWYLCQISPQIMLLPIRIKIDLRDTLRNHSTKSLKNNPQQSKQSDLHYETDHNIETSRDQTTSINVIINSNKGHYFAHSECCFNIPLSLLTFHSIWRLRSSHKGHRIRKGPRSRLVTRLDTELVLSPLL